MKVGVIGTGHVGLVTCATLAHLTHEVAGVDEDESKVALLRDGRSPFFEPKLQALLDEEIASGRLTFSSAVGDAVAGMDVVFVCVGTPADADGEANLLAVERAAEQIATAATGPIVVVEKSTVPAGTAERVAATLRKRRPHVAFEVVSNPEFLREGSAVEDSFEPDRILVGAGEEHARVVMRRLYAPLVNAGVPLIETDVTTAELAKHASNAFLALKVSYVNALARLCERSGADVMSVARVMGADRRIGPEFLVAGLGYGGYCFPKDVAAFRSLARRLGYDFALLDEVVRINDDAVESVLVRVKEVLWNLSGKRVLVLGLAFKPMTDDVRFSPSLALIRRLRDLGADVIAHDPHAAAEARAEDPELETADDVYRAAQGAYAAVLATSWPEYLELDWARMGKVMCDRVVVDARNALDPAPLLAAGFEVHAIGRPSVVSMGEG